MKVISLRQPASLESLTLEDRPEPRVGAGQVKVRWRASSLNFHDFAVAIGMLPTVDGRIPMSDGAGEIVEVGDGVSSWKVGDRVMSLFFPDWQDGAATPAQCGRIPGDSCDGYAAEFSVLAANAVTAMPAGYSFAEAATLPCAALTAWRAVVVECGVKPGDRVLVEGTGGMAMFCLQFAKAAGATVFATSSSDDKLQRLKALGADHLINYSRDPNWGETVNQLSGGGVDHVVDSGGAATLDGSVTAARIAGNVVMVGVLGGVMAQLNVGKLIFKQQRLLPIAVGSRSMQLDMVRAIDANGIRPVLDKSFALDQLADAFRYQRSGQHFGKIVLEI